MQCKIFFKLALFLLLFCVCEQNCYATSDSSSEDLSISTKFKKEFEKHNLDLNENRESWLNQRLEEKERSIKSLRTRIIVSSLVTKVCALSAALTSYLAASSLIDNDDKGKALLAVGIISSVGGLAAQVLSTEQIKKQETQALIAKYKKGLKDLIAAKETKSKNKK